MEKNTNNTFDVIDDDHPLSNDADTGSKPSHQTSTTTSFLPQEDAVVGGNETVRNRIRIAVSQSKLEASVQAPLSAQSNDSSKLPHIDSSTSLEQIRVYLNGAIDSTNVLVNEALFKLILKELLKRNVDRGEFKRMTFTQTLNRIRKNSLNDVLIRKYSKLLRKIQARYGRPFGPINTERLQSELNKSALLKPGNKRARTVPTAAIIVDPLEHKRTSVEIEATNPNTARTVSSMQSPEKPDVFKGYNSKRELKEQRTAPIVTAAQPIVEQFLSSKTQTTVHVNQSDLEDTKPVESRKRKYAHLTLESGTPTAQQSMITVENSTKARVRKINTSYLVRYDFLNVDEKSTNAADFSTANTNTSMQEMNEPSILSAAPCTSEREFTSSLNKKQKESLQKNDAEFGTRREKGLNLEEDDESGDDDILCNIDDMPGLTLSQLMEEYILPNAAVPREQPKQPKVYSRWIERPKPTFACSPSASNGTTAEKKVDIDHATNKDNTDKDDLMRDYDPEGCVPKFLWDNREMCLPKTRERDPKLCLLYSPRRILPFVNICGLMDEIPLLGHCLNRDDYYENFGDVLSHNPKPPHPWPVLYMSMDAERKRREILQRLKKNAEGESQALPQEKKNDVANP